MTTIQTQAHRGTYTPSSTRVRGVKGFVIGFAVLVAAVTGIVMSRTEAPSVVIAPVTYSDPSSEQREALKRFHEQAATGSTESEVVWFQPGKPGIK
jgi:hypothetical protein